MRQTPQTITGQLNLGDGTLYYETAGAGEPLVLSHAGFLDSRMFDAQWEALARHFHVIRYDMRGYGQSSPASGPLCRRTDLHRLLDHLHITRAHLVGCSYGGQLLLDMALEMPTLAASLTLVGSAPSGFPIQGEPPRYLNEMFESALRGDVDRASELQIRIWFDGNYREPGQVDSVLRTRALQMNHISVAQKTFLIADLNPLNPLDPPAVTRLSEVICPTWIVAGSLDHPEILRAAHFMTENIAHVRQTLIENSAHVPSFEQPTIFLNLLLDFLGSVQELSEQH